MRLGYCPASFHCALRYSEGICCRLDLVLINCFSFGLSRDVFISPVLPKENSSVSCKILSWQYSFQTLNTPTHLFFFFFLLLKFLMGNLIFLKIP